MKKNWEGADDCEAIRNHFSFMSVQEAAALWCGISKGEIPEQLKMCTPYSDSSEYGKHIFKHPFVSCLEPRCRVIQDAINDSRLKVGRDGGQTALIAEIGHVAYARRTINLNDLKEYIKENFPSNMPKTLFDEVERSSHKAITTESYMALQADRDALKTDLARTRALLVKANSEKESLLTERDHLRQMVDTVSTGQSSKQLSSLIVIAVILEGMRHARQKKNLPTAGLQTSLIESMVEACDGITGISTSSLQKTFAEANSALKKLKNKDLI